MSEYVNSSNGVPLPLSDLEKTFTYDGSNNLISIAVIYIDITYVQTFTYTAGNLTDVSQWIPQA